MNALFSSLAPFELSEEELLLRTANLFAKDWIERQLSEKIREALWSISGRHYEFRIIFDDTAIDQENQQQAVSQKPTISQKDIPSGHIFEATGNKKNKQLSPLSIQALFEGAKAVNAPQEKAAVPTATPVVDGLESIVPGTSYTGQTFESFVVGEANLRAFSLALQVAKNPGYITNPFFIYGKSGLGKTHLLLSIDHYIQEHTRGLRTVYIQTNDLVGEYSQAARQGDFSDFNRKYFYQCDVFLLDDVQFLEKREETINTVFNIFNHLTAANKQVVLSADRAPHEISLHERYLSRFNNGIIADVQAPSYETKLTIFKNYLDFCFHRFNREDARALIKDDVVEYTVSLSGSNIRELEGAATNLVWTLINDHKNRYTPITVEEAEPIVSKHFRRLEKKSIDIQTIQRETENFFNIRHEDLLGTQRSQDISYPRQVAMYLCRNLTDASYPYIGKAFGGKDHTSVIHAYNNIEKKRQLSQKVDNEIKHLMDQILE